MRRPTRATAALLAQYVRRPQAERLALDWPRPPASATVSLTDFLEAQPEALAHVADPQT